MDVGLVVPPGGGRRIVTPAQDIVFKVTGADGSAASVFEVLVPPGFDVGAHLHEHSEELFYVLDGAVDVFAFEPRQRIGTSWYDWESSAGHRPVSAPAGACMFVPRGCPHAFVNRGEQPARMLFLSTPSPAHERYFEQLAEIFAAGDAPDPDAVALLRRTYDIVQITPLRFDAPGDEGRV